MGVMCWGYVSELCVWVMCCGIGIIAEINVRFIVGLKRGRSGVKW